MRYPIFEDLVNERSILFSRIATAIGIDEKSLRNKRYGRTEFTLTEAMLIRDEFFPDITIDRLFDTADLRKPRG